MANAFVFFNRMSNMEDSPVLTKETSCISTMANGQSKEFKAPIVSQAFKDLTLNFDCTVAQEHKTGRG